MTSSLVIGTMARNLNLVVLVLALGGAAGFAPQRSTARSHVLRSTPEADEVVEEAAAPAEEAAPAAPAAPGRYDVSKLVGGASKEGGFNQFDPVLSATQGLSRRFGLVGGLSVFGVLAFVEGGEIVKGLTNSEPTPGANVLVTTASGLQYTESLVGRGGDSPLPGSVVGIDVRVSIGDKVIFDTKGDKPVAWKYGQRPFQNVICDGVEEGVRGMKVGGKRRLSVPAKLAPAGVAGTLPDGVPLVFDVELKEVLPGYF